MAAAAPELESIRLEEEALRLRHEISMAEDGDEDVDDDDDGGAGGGGGGGGPGPSESMLEPLEGGEDATWS